MYIYIYISSLPRFMPSSVSFCMGVIIFAVNIFEGSFFCKSLINGFYCY